MLARGRAKSKVKAATRRPASGEAAPGKSNSPSPTKEAQIFKLFQQVDANGDGKISHEELKKVLVACGCEASSAHKLFKALDVGRDGVVDYDRFLAWVFNEQAPKKMVQALEAATVASDGSEWGRLYTRRPQSVSEASAMFFREQGSACKDKAYGTVGSPDYVIETREKFEKVCLMSVWDVVNSFEDPSSLRILDLGTGDGHLLYGLHERFGIPWSNLVGVSAEDMRGLGFPVAEGVPPLDLHEVRASHGSYIIWNIDNLQNCKAIQGRTFDIIVSFLTFCWLTDPFGALEVAHDRFLAPGGLLLCSSLLLQVVGVDAMDDQRYLAALRDYLRAEGHEVDVMRDPSSGFNSVWFQRKVKDCLHLWPSLDYGAILEGSSKLEYVVKLSPGPELEVFDARLLTMFTLGTSHGLTCEASQQAEACFRMLKASGQGVINGHTVLKLPEEVLGSLPATARDVNAEISLADWMNLMSAVAQAKGLPALLGLCKHSLAELVIAKSQQDADEEFKQAEFELYYGHPAYQSGPLWDIKVIGFRPEDPPEMRIVLPVWQAVCILIAQPPPKAASLEELRRSILEIRTFKDKLRSLAEARGTDDFLKTWGGDHDAMRQALASVEALMSCEDDRSFDSVEYSGLIKKYPSVSFYFLATKCLCIWLREVVKEMRARASCFVATVAVIERMATFTNMAGTMIMPALCLDTLTIGSAKAAISKAAAQNHVQLISTDGAALAMADSMLVEDALQSLVP